MQGRRISNRYQLETPVQTSRSFDIYQGYDSFLPRAVSITVFHHCDFSADMSFRMRVQSIAKLSHPHIMSIYDMEYEDRVCYLISELQTGTTLWDARFQQENFSMKESLSIAANLADAIAHAHEQNVTHGQLSADSIWLKDKDIKLSFVYSLLSQELVNEKQTDLRQLGEILEQWFSTVHFSETPIQKKVEEIVERLVGKRQPVYRNVSDAAYDLKTILAKCALRPSVESVSERKETASSIVTKAEREALLKDWLPASKYPFQLQKRPTLRSYLAASAGMLAVGFMLSLFAVNETSDLSTNRLTTSIESGTAGLAMAETPQQSGTITISPKEPISKVSTATPNEPRLIGLNKEEAERMLLSLDIRYAYYLVRSDAPIGTVFKQEWDPAASRPFSRIVFYVSVGQ